MRIFYNSTMNINISIDIYCGFILAVYPLLTN